MTDLLAGQETPDQGQRLVEAPAAGAGIDPGVAHLAAVFPGHADAEGQAAGGGLREGGQLPRGQHGVAQPEQVDADQHRQALVGGQQRARRDQAVEARAAVETDVVADRDVVQARRRAPVEQPLPGAEVGQREGVLVRDPDLDRCHGELPSGRAWI